MIAMVEHLVLDKEGHVGEKYNREVSMQIWVDLIFQ